ncbi:MAG: ATP-binding protein [Sedimentisphaerales bacterium]
MKTVTVKVQDDHVESLAHVKKPILAIAELVWNGLDANANEVKVTLNRNSLGSIESVVVTDNGHGLPDTEAVEAFGNLGGSWKKKTRTTRGRERLLHGKAGKGRFRAFALGKVIRWQTRYESNGQVFTYEITGYSDRLLEFQIGDVRSSKVKETGTEVEVSEMQKEFRKLDGKEAHQEMMEHFSLYMSLYEDVKIKYDGVQIDPLEAMESREDYELSEIELENGERITANLTIIEWKKRL